MHVLKNKKLHLLFIALILFVIPFFWMKPGEMDLGGDGSRLYFYDPTNYLKSFALYAISPVGVNQVNPAYFFLPFNILLIGSMWVLKSPYLLITLFNSFHLVIMFLSMYAITKEFFADKADKNVRRLVHLSALFVGLYYTFSPIMVRTEWDRAIFTHTRIFLSPLIFYLLLKFFNTAKSKYLFIALLVTFIFSTNFSWGGAPSLFSFYPIAIVYLFIYARFVKKIAINVKGIVVAAFLYFAIHAFHLIPFISNIPVLAFDKTFSRVGKIDTGLEYFTGSAAHINLTDNLLGLPQLVPSIIPYQILFFAVPALLIIGLFVNQKLSFLSKQERINYLLLFAFFLVTTFFATANITDVGFNFYKNLFNIPGFSMFRNYYGQWLLPYLFFLSLLLGQTVVYTFIALRKKPLQAALFIFLSLLVVTSAYPFIRGDMINTTLNQGAEMEFKVPIKMDPIYEQVLAYIRNIPIDAKFFTFPHSEAYVQVLIGAQGGMYIGPSTISQLTGKSDFNGYQVLPPFNEVFLPLAKEKDYQSIGRMLGLLNIRYIFYNSNPRVLDVFPNFPYAQYLRQFLPDKQASYKEFIETLPIKKEKSFGSYYHIYTLDDIYYLPHIYVGKKLVFFSAERHAPWGHFTDIFFRYTKDYEARTVYLEDKQIAAMPIKNIPKITFTKINPTKYYIKVLGANDPYTLVLSDAFNPQWKLYLSDKQVSDPIIADYFNGAIKETVHKSIWLDKDTFETWGKTQVAKDKHIVANGYANAWYITPSDTVEKLDYTLILEMTAQRNSFISDAISVTAVVICLLGMAMLLLQTRRKRDE